MTGGISSSGGSSSISPRKARIKPRKFPLHLLLLAAILFQEVHSFVLPSPPSLIRGKDSRFYQRANDMPMSCGLTNPPRPAAPTLKQPRGMQLDDDMEDISSFDDEDESFRDNNNKGSNIGSSYTINDFTRDEEFQKRSNRWILIVDDEEPIRRAVGQLLFDRGYQVTACADAPTALRIAQEQRSQSDNNSNGRYPDVIVSDIRMPEMSGLEFLQTIRNNPDLQGIPVVLLTAKGRTEDRIDGYDAGADAYLPKPFDPDELVSICDSLIQQYDLLNGNNLEVEDLQQDLNDIKRLLLEKGGAGVGNGWVDKQMVSNVFLAPDERQVLEFLCEGLMNKEIAGKTYLSTRRVEQLLTSMYRKVNVKNRTELVRWAVSSGNVQM